MKRVFNPGAGFVDSYDYSFSGLGLTKGCVFGCSFCYAPTILHMELQDFVEGGKEVRLSLDEFRTALEKEVHLLKGKSLYLNVMTDPYQPKVCRYTRIMLVVLSDAHPRKVVIQTRSPLVCADIDVIHNLYSARVNFTMETNDEDVRKDFMPTSPNLQKRWSALRQLTREGIPVCITCTPTLPFLKSRESIEEWCDYANELPTLTHVVVQKFHNGTLTNTSPEGLAKSTKPEYDWFFSKSGYEYLKNYLSLYLRVPVMEGKPGFAPDAPN